MNIKCQILAVTTLVASFAHMAGHAAHANPDSYLVSGMSSFSSLAENNPEAVIGLIGAGRAIRSQSVHIDHGQIVITSKPDTRIIARATPRPSETEQVVAKATPAPVLKAPVIVAAKTPATVVASVKQPIIAEMSHKPVSHVVATAIAKAPVVMAELAKKVIAETAPAAAELPVVADEAPQREASVITVAEVMSSDPMPMLRSSGGARVITISGNRVFVSGGQ